MPRVPELLRLRDVKELLRDPRDDHAFRQWMLRAERRGAFPPAVPYSERVLFWEREAVVQWLKSRPARGPQKQTEAVEVPAGPLPPQIEVARPAARTLAEILQHLLDHGSWYCSAIELNTHDPEHVDGEELEAEARESLLATGRRP